MQITGTIASFITPTTVDKKLQLEDSTHHELLTIECNTSVPASDSNSHREYLNTILSNWDILSLPVSILVDILQFAIPTNGDSIIEFSTTCTLFHDLLHHKIKSNRNHIERPLIPIHLSSGYNPFIEQTVESISVDIAKWNESHTLPIDKIFRCNTLTLYSSLTLEPYDDYLSSKLDSVLSMFKSDTIIVESCINSIPWLYTYLDRVKKDVRKYIIRTCTSYDSLLEKKHHRVSKLPERVLKIDNRTFNTSPCYQISLYGDALKPQMFPSTRYLYKVLST